MLSVIENNNMGNLSVKKQQGFTLVELSIVLVVIGLVIGGVIVGQSLIAAAKMRSGIAQIESYRISVHTFKNKYGELPGDMPPALASRLSFAVRTGAEGQGDGNGVLEGMSGNATRVATGELSLFWQDLSDSGLIKNKLTAFTPLGAPATTVTRSTTPSIDDYFPRSKFDSHLSTVVWSGEKGVNNSQIKTGENRFSVLQVDRIDSAQSGYIYAYHPMEVTIAWNIDNKIDDGFPITGSVTAQYTSYSVAPLYTSLSRNVDPLTVALAPTGSTCFDNNNVGGDKMEYTTDYNSGNNKSCALSFKF